MPVHKTAGGGEQWGSHGHVYHGPDAKEKAEAQGRAAYANGYRGDETEEPSTQSPVENKTDCAGVLFRAPDGRFLVLRRSDSPEWDLPGGHLDSGEDAETAAVRETQEEIGLRPGPGLQKLGVNETSSIRYTTFLQNVPGHFKPTLNDEHVDYKWASLAELPAAVHPQVRRYIELLGPSKNELDIMRSMRSGDLQSPQRYENIWLFNLRITGTGASYRSAHDEYVWRDPGIFLSNDFVERCNGLPLIFLHPNDGLLNTNEFRQRIVGIVTMPYVDGDEVWGIAKVYDEDAAQLMASGAIPSTSPAVVFRDAGSTETADYNGRSVLIEGKPSYLDHLAICEVGVWDKGEAPSGINHGDQTMADEEKVKQEEKAPAWADALVARMDSMTARMDAMEEAKKEEKEEEEEKADSEEPEKEEKEEKEEKADSEESEEEKEKSEEEKADSEESEEKEVKEEPKARSDSQTAKENAALKQQLAALEARLSTVTQPLSHTDRDQLAEAQARADATYQLLGARASAPILGENPISYRKRLAAGLQKHSQQFREVALDSLDGPIFETVEKSIYADAEAASRSPEVSKTGMLLPQVRKDSAGREITTFTGDMGAWLNAFKSSGQVVSFNRDEMRRGVGG